jgi:hypothetical protein
MEDQDTKTENWLTSLLVAMVLLISGTLLIFLAGRVTTLSCLRESNQVNCSLSSRLLNRYLPQESNVVDLRSVYVEESCDDSCSYRVILVNPAGEVPLTSTLDSDKSGEQSKVNQINQYLQNTSQASFVLVSEAGLWPYAGMIVTVIGLLLSLWTGGKAFLSVIQNR